MTIPNTRRAVERAVAKGPGAAGSVLYSIRSVAGLRLRVGQTLATWRFTYTAGGRRSSVSLGAHPAIDLADAVVRATLMRAEVRTTGRPPCPQREATFGDAIEEYLRIEGPSFAPGTIRAKRYVLEGPPSATLRRIPIAELTADDLRRAMNRQKAPTTTDRVKKEVGAVLGWALERGTYALDQNVARVVKSRASRAPRTRVLSPTEIVTFWRATEAPSKGNAFLRTLLLTGQRTQELRLAKWTDIEDGVWYVRHRKGTEETNPIPLSSLALQEVERARGFNSAFLFPAEPRGTGPWKDGPARQHAYRLARRAGMEPWAPHDLRRTLRSILSELGTDHVLAEKIVGHSLRGMVRVYDVAPAIEPKRLALEGVAEFIMDLTGEPADPA